MLPVVRAASTEVREGDPVPPDRLRIVLETVGERAEGPQGRLQRVGLVRRRVRDHPADDDGQQLRGHRGWHPQPRKLPQHPAVHDDVTVLEQGLRQLDQLEGERIGDARAGHPQIDASGTDYLVAVEQRRVRDREEVAQRLRGGCLLEHVDHRGPDRAIVHLVTRGGREQCQHRGKDIGRPGGRTASYRLGKPASARVAPDPQRLALHARHHPIDGVVGRDGGCVTVGGAERQDRAEQLVDVDGDLDGKVGCQGHQMLGGMVGRLVPPVTARSPDDEADRLRRRHIRCVPGLSKSLQEPGDARQLIPGVGVDRGGMGLDDAPGQRRLAPPCLGESAQRGGRWMGVASVPGIRAMNTRGKGRPERDDTGRIDRQEHPGGVRSRFARRIVIASEVLDDRTGDRGEIDARRRDQAVG